MTVAELNNFNLGLQKGRYLISIGLTEEEALDGNINADVKRGIIAAYHPTADALSSFKPSSIAELNMLADTVNMMNIPNQKILGSSSFCSILSARAKRLGYHITTDALIVNGSVIHNQKKIFDYLHMPFVVPKDRLKINDSWFAVISDDTLPFFTAAVHIPQYSIDLILQGRAANKDEFLKIQASIPHTETTRNTVYFLDNLQPQEIKDWGTEPDMTQVKEWILSYTNKGYQQ